MAGSGSTIYVGPGKLGKVLGVGARRVQQLVAEGLPREDHGKYDLAKCMMWFIRWQDKIIKSQMGDPEGPGKNIRVERERGLRVDAELKELQLAERRRQLVSIADVENTLTKMALTTKALMLAIPPRLAGDLVNVTSRVMAQALIEKAINEALSHLAATDVRNP